MSIITGKKNHKKYRKIELEKAVGKTVEAITESRIQGAYGTELVIAILFTDGTKIGFVIESDD